MRRVDAKRLLYIFLSRRERLSAEVQSISWPGNVIATEEVPTSSRRLGTVAAESISKSAVVGATPKSVDDVQHTIAIIIQHTQTYLLLSKKRWRPH